MAWEQRGNHRYYYRARKVNGRVHKEYVGTGPLAEAVSQHDARAREMRRAAKVQRSQEHEAILALDAPVNTFTDTLETLMRTSLLLAGYHRHHGSEWRKRRHGQ